VNTERDIKLANRKNKLRSKRTKKKNAELAERNKICRETE
jgi:hypothetical protein